MKYVVYLVAIGIVFGTGLLIGKRLGFEEVKSRQPNLYNLKEHQNLRIGDYWITYPGGNPGVEYAISIYEDDGWNRILYRNGDGELFIYP